MPRSEHLLSQNEDGRRDGLKAKGGIWSERTFQRTDAGGKRQRSDSPACLVRLGSMMLTTKIFQLGILRTVLEEVLGVAIDVRRRHHVLNTKAVQAGQR